MSFLLGSANSASGGYEITNSLRFGTNTDLKRLPSATGQSVKGTLSVWVKFATPDTEMAIIGGFDNSGANDNDGYFVFKRTADGNLQFEGGDNVYLETTALFRDTSAWYHIVLAIDSGNGTANNKQRIYVNGAEVTAFDTRNNLTNLQDLPMNTTAGNDDALLIGCDEDTGGKGLFFDGYMSEFYWIDQNQYAASDFGETNDNGVWIPKEFAGSFGVNGVFLQFKQTGTSANASGIGADTGGGTLHFTVTNLTAVDVCVDTPTNNFATLMPTKDIDLAEGNLVMSHDREYWDGAHATIGLTSGKWYWEHRLDDADGDDRRIVGGVVSNPETYPHIYDGKGTNADLAGDPYTAVKATSPSYMYTSWANNLIFDGTSTYNNQWVDIDDDDVLSFALDLDNNKFFIAVNGSYIAGDDGGTDGDPAAGTNETFDIVAASTSRVYFPAAVVGWSTNTSSTTASFNFGNSSFAISTGNADTNGIGNFEYAVPDGFYSICTKNLAKYGG